MPPQGLDCATCSRQSCARLFTPTRPPWKGGVPRVLAHGYKKRRQPFDCLLQYPLRGSTALLAVDSRVLVCLHPPDLPGREAYPGFSPRGTKKRRQPFDCLLQYPLRGSTALLAVGSRVLVCFHPPDLPGREVYPGFSPRGTKKEDNLSIVFFSTPSGARTLDPNIKSVVLYQLS